MTTRPTHRSYAHEVQDTVTIEEAAAQLGVGLPLMRALLVHQRVPGAYDMGDDGWLIPRAAVAAFAAERAAEQDPPTS